MSSPPPPPPNGMPSPPNGTNSPPPGAPPPGPPGGGGSGGSGGSGGMPMSNDVIPLMLGLAFDAIMMGIIIQQFIFWNTWERRTEKKGIKGIILVISAISLAVTIYTIWWMIHLVENGLSATQTSPAEQTLFANYFIFDTCIAFIAQCFFAQRAYKINKRGIIILILVTPLILASASGSLGLAVVVRYNGAMYEKAVQVFFYLWTLSGVLVDLILLFSIAWGLRRAKTGWRNTDNLVNRLIRLSFETQLPGTLIAIALFIQFLVNRGSPWHYFFTILQSKVYTVGILAVLNARASVKKTISNLSGSHSNSKENSYKPSSGGHHQATVDLSPKEIWSSSDGHGHDRFSSSRDLNAPDEMELEDRIHIDDLEAKGRIEQSV